MDSTYYVATIAILLFALIWVLQYASDKRREVQRHKDAAVNYRRFVVDQKTKFIGDLVERLDLRARGRLPGLDLGRFLKVEELYRDPALIGYRMPILARDLHTINWTRELADLEDVELFGLWYERVIKLANQDKDST